jgi:AcrR family transcriptional regulator
MARIYSGKGDPGASMELLWAEHGAPKRGPRPRLQLAQVIDAAVALADSEGVEALSMRKLAERLETSAMSLYTYTKGRAELVDLMIDRVLGELCEPVAEAAGWRQQLEAIAYDNRALMRRHPWLSQLMTHRPVLGPKLLAKYDRELKAVEGLGLSDVEMDMTITLLNEYVFGAARAIAEAPGLERETGMTDQQWWERYGPLLEKVFNPDQFPTAARVGSAASESYGGLYDPEGTFAFGLARVLDGIELLVSRRQGRDLPR